MLFSEKSRESQQITQQMTNTDKTASMCVLVFMMNCQSKGSFFLNADYFSAQRLFKCDTILPDNKGLTDMALAPNSYTLEA